MRRDDERLIDVRDAARAARRFIKGRKAADVVSDELLAAALIQMRSTHGPSPERRRHLLATIFFPAKLPIHASDLSVLRSLADDGNEEAERRLTELAVERGDVEQLRRLADDGNEEAERRLTELIRAMQ